MKSWEQISLTVSTMQGWLKRVSRRGKVHLKVHLKDGTGGSMSFYIVSEGRSGQVIFLADRRKTNSQWWTSSTKKAMCFFHRSAVREALSKLLYNNPRIIEDVEAGRIERDNLLLILHDDVQPFSEAPDKGHPLTR